MNADTLARNRYRGWLAVLLFLWVGTSLVLNLPGHLSTDSLVQVVEGRTLVFESYNPRFISMVFGKVVEFTDGTGFLVLASEFMLAGSLWLMLAGVPAPRRVGLVLLFVLLASPVFLIYPATVWKDVWFAHLALFGFALTGVRQGERRWGLEALTLLVFAFAMLSRQTGVLVALAGVLALTLAERRADGSRPGWPRRVLGAAVRTAVLVIYGMLLSAFVREVAVEASGAQFGSGMRLVAIFDIAGMLKQTPEAHLDRLRALGVDTPPLEASARATFSAERIDTLESTGSAAFWTVSLPDVFAQWGDLVREHPLGYLAHRADTYAWLLGLRDQSRCLPVHVGFDAASDLTRRAGIDPRPSAYRGVLYQYSLHFVGTPYFSPLAWALVSLCVALVFIRRGRWAHPVAALQYGGVLYLLSYGPIGMSCDFRYAYFSVLAAAVGVAFIVIDRGVPRGARRT